MNTPTPEPQKQHELFPRRLSLIAIALSALLLTAAGGLIAVMHRDFDNVNRVQIPVLEMASINLRLANQLETQTAALLKNPNKAALDEYRMAVDSLAANLEDFRKALEAEPRFQPFVAQIPSNRMINNASAVHNLVLDKKTQSARKLFEAETFAHDTEKFVQGVGDVTESLSHLRDELLRKQIRNARIVATGTGLLLLFLGFLFWRIYRAFRINLRLREEAEAQVAHLSLQRKQLIHVLCHDLGNPVASITGFMDYLAHEDAALREQAVDMIRRSAIQAQSIIDLIAKVQALESGKLTLEMQPHSLRALVTESVDLLAERVRKKKLQINLDLSPDLQVLVEKTSFVNSVVNNVLTNAIKFSERGSTIEIEARAIPADDGAAGEPRVEMLIRDHGVGMPAELLANVFRDDRATNRKGTGGEAGTGFGMPLVRKFVHAYGGEIAVASIEAPAANCGTEITLKLKAVA